MGWIAIDLDGTLAKYYEWEGVDKIGEPVPLMLNRVKNWLECGYEVKIFTARVGPQKNMEDISVARTTIENWCLKHIGRILEVTNEKDFNMIELWDDRAIRVKRNTGEIC